MLLTQIKKFPFLKFEVRKELLKEINLKKMIVEIKTKIFDLPNCNNSFLFEKIDSKFNFFKKSILIETQILKNKELINQSLSQSVDWQSFDSNILELDDFLKDMMKSLEDFYSKYKIKSEKVFSYYQSNF